MGIYFDLTADTYEYWTTPYVIVPAFVILTHPTFDAVYGYELGFTIEGNYVLSGVTLAGTGAIDVGGLEGNHIVGLATPLPTTEATRLMTLNVFVLDSNPLYFTLHGALPNSVPGSEVPALLLAGDTIIPTCVSAGPGNVCAIINGTGVVATDETSLDALKALYR